MRGEVEIWDGDKLIHKESNLLVNGAGEAIADMLTVSPSLSGIASASALLDTSNYTIQAISFGKDASAYQYNAHKYGDRRNLFYDSTFSSIGEGNRNNGCWKNPDSFLVSSVPSESNPPGFEDIPSSVAHVTMLADLSALDDGGTGGNCSFSYGLNFRVSNTPQTGPYSVSALQDKWFCTSVYIKAPVPTHPYNLNIIDSSVSPKQAKLEFKNTIESPGTATTDPAYSVGRSRNSVVFYWDPTTDPHTPSGISIASFQSDPRTVAAGFTEDLWNANGGVQDVGNGWYRMWNATPAPSGADNYSCALHAAGWDAGDNYGETSGGVFTFGWQVEVGKWPTPLQINSGYQANGWDLSGSVLNQWYAKYGSEAAHPLDKGTVRVLNEPIPNPNLLFYTEDPHSSPGITSPTDVYSYYWNGDSTNVNTFSSIVETNPFGGVSCIELSGKGTAANNPLLAANPLSAIELGGTARNRTLNTGYATIWSIYVKKPTSGYSPSGFSLMIHDRTSPPAHQVNHQYFDFDSTSPAGATPVVVPRGQDYQSGYVEDVGNGWYRCSTWLSGLGAGGVNGNTLDGDQYDNRIYFVSSSDSPGPPNYTERLWLYGPQVEKWPLGVRRGGSPYPSNQHHQSTPTKYRAVSGNVPTYAEDNLLTSSYTPTNYLSSPPNPASTRVEDNNTTVETFSGIFSSIDFGQNLNMVPWRDYSGMQTQLRTPTSFSGYSIIDVAHPKTIYVKDYSWPFAGNAQANYEGNNNLYTSGVGTLGNQAYYLGCYPEGSSTGGSNWALVSSLDNSAAYLQVANGTDSNFVSGTYNSIVNEASSMDAFGFVGKVYDPKQVVGNVPNPNMFAYTVYWTDDPDVDPDDGDFNGTWTCNANMMGGWSAVDVTNPFGGPSSMVVSAGIDPESGGSDVVYALALAQNPENDYTVTPNFLVSAGNSYYQSMYVKRGGTLAEGYTSSMIIKIKDVDATGPPDTTVGYQHTIEYADDGVVPTVKNADANSILTIEDVGNDWYRFINRVDGNNLHSDTAIGDRLTCYWYLGDTAGTGGSRENITDETNGKKLYMWAPQAEVHPTSYGISSTPYQAVSGLSPTVAEQQGEGGLHVSGGIDATNSGTVQYSMIVGSGDVGYSNLYGGIYNMGLWTIDMDESIKAGNTPPYSFGPLNNPRKYKLFATKHLTKNLGYIEDNGTNAGSLNYSDLTIKWRLHFL